MMKYRRSTTPTNLFTILSLLLLATFSLAADILSNGDSVSEFVGRNIHDHEVRVEEQNSELLAPT